MKELTPQQQEAAILWLARKSNGMTIEQIAEKKPETALFRFIKPRKSRRIRGG
jgi:hypothetical protein